jgi:hypothetical protein
MRLRFAFAGILVIVLSFSVVSRGADPDQSSPKAAALSLWAAIDRGDAEAAKKLCVFSNDDQPKWVEGFAAMCDGFHKMHDAAVKRFGIEAEKQFTPNSPAHYAAATLEKSEVTEDGDEAKVIPPGAPAGSGVIVRRKDGKWRVVLTEGLKGQDIVRSVEVFQAMGRSGREVASAIDAGKYADAKAAEQGLRDLVKKYMAPTTAGKVVPDGPSAPAQPGKN